jgi:hypothetical protein
MCAMVLSTSVPSTTDGDWIIVFGLICTLTSALMHWRFKTGWQMTWGRMIPSPNVYPTYVCMLYAGLPFTIGSLGLTTIGVLGRLDLISTSWVGADLMLLAVMVALAGGGWGVKEFCSPTRSRTPARLAEIGD